MSDLIDQFHQGKNHTELENQLVLDDLLRTISIHTTDNIDPLKGHIEKTPTYTFQPLIRRHNPLGGVNFNTPLSVIGELAFDTNT